MELLARGRDTLTRRHEYPQQRDVTDEEPRIGVFICHCGHNIASVVDVNAVARQAAELPDVVYSETDLFTCSDTSQARLRDVILQHRLNRVVIASCSPRTHEALFQETLRESGLNPYLFSMTNIRDQCSWVHRDDPAQATEKACDLMRMAVGRARWLRALETRRVPITRAALVLGGGLAGMTAALSVADQGFDVHLVEKEAELGGNLRSIHYTLERADIQEFAADLISRVEAHPRITTYMSSQVVEVSGHVGNFKSQIEGPGGAKTVRHGVTIIATGGVERPTEQHLHGRHERVVTQRELEGQLASGGLPAGPGRMPDDRDDSVRRLADRGEPLLQPRLLLGGGEERPRAEGAAAAGAGDRPGEGHPHLRLPRDVLPEGAGGGRAVHPLPGGAGAPDVRGPGPGSAGHGRQHPTRSPAAGRTCSC